MKNVLIVYHYIAHYRVPLFKILSKSQSPLYTICSGLKSEISIKTADPQLALTNVNDGGLRWSIIKNYWFFKIILFQFGILKLSLSNKYDTFIFLGVMYYPTTWLAAILVRLRGKKVIFWTHGYIRNEQNLKGLIRKLFYKLADEILVYGQRAKDILISKGFEKEKIKLIYNSLDYDNQLNIRDTDRDKKLENPFKNKNLPTIGFIGRLTQQKKIDELLSMLYNINTKSDKANLLIIGSGEEENQLKQKTHQLKLEEYVVFYGPCYDERKIFLLMQHMNVIVSPGEVGLTAIHALTYGVPVITHNRFDLQMPEYEVIKPGITGEFFKYGDLKSMTEITKKWLSKKDKTEVQINCYSVIDLYYNPYKQKEIFDSVI